MPPNETQPDPLIAGHFAVDAARLLPDAGGGLPAFAATDRRDERARLMAVQLRRHLPARAAALPALFSAPVESVLTPLAHGRFRLPDGTEAGCLICPAPPGPPIAAQLHPWSEPELLACVMRPIARALDQLAARRLTHRGIRPENIFRAAPGQPVVLGCAWAAPPGMFQPAVAEPPYVAMCHPAGRDDGAIADDIYALGVLLLTLALGRAPLAGLSDHEVIRRKLDLGSHAALLGEQRVGSLLGDLLRGMLAEDPEHRPPPALLLDPAAARARRIAARPAHRAQRAFVLAATTSWHPRALAHALATHPEAAIHALKLGAVALWLRRVLGDSGLASRVEEQVKIASSATQSEQTQAGLIVLMRVVAVLDPRAPLCWDGQALWPKAIGPLLAAALAGDGGAGPELAGRLAALIRAQAGFYWATVYPERHDVGLARMEARQMAGLLQLKGYAGDLPRLLYQLNPMLPCLSALLAATWVAQAEELPAALEATQRQAQGAGPRIDRAVAAFLAARGERKLESILTRLGNLDPPEDPLAQLRLLAALQARYHPGPLPALGAWFVAQAETLLASWRSRSRRAALLPRVRELAEAGRLVDALALLDHPDGHRQDELEARRAAERVAEIDLVLERLGQEGPARAQQARQYGQEIAAGAGLLALAAMLIAAAIG
jgi:hypothetical protein